eukprot:8305078-Pyramimonas_sp.AAC.1
MLEQTPSGHLAIPCSNYGEATPGAEGESAAGTFTDARAGSSSQHVTEAARGQAPRACQDIGEHSHEALGRCMDQAVDDAITMVVSSTMGHWHRSDRPVDRYEMTRMLPAGIRNT